MTEINRQMTDRALAGLIRYGRQVTLLTPELPTSSITGFVTGFDDENVRVAVVNKDNFVDYAMRARSFVAGYDEHLSVTVSTMNPTVRKELENALKPVREFVMRKYFTRP